MFLITIAGDILVRIFCANDQALSEVGGYLAEEGYCFTVEWISSLLTLDSSPTEQENAAAAHIMEGVFSHMQQAELEVL